MIAVYWAQSPPRCRTARPSAFSKGSSWRVFSASLRTRARSGRSIAPALTARGNKARTVPLSAGILTHLQEVPENLPAELRVLHFRVELEAENGLGPVPHRLNGAVGRARESDEPRWQHGHLVVVGLPHLEAVREALEEHVGLADVQEGLPELRHLGGSRFPAEVLRHELMSRADAEDRPAERIEILPVAPHLGRIDANARRASGKDEPVEILETSDGGDVRNNFRLDPEVLQDPPFAVGPLPSVVDDENTHGIPKGRSEKKVSIDRGAYSHSIVAGGLFEMSYTTRLTPGTSFVMRVEIRSSTSWGIFEYVALMPSIDSTARTATVCP